MQLWWQRVVEAIETQEAAQDALIENVQTLLSTVIDLNNLITDVEAATVAAQVAADAANAAAGASAAESSLVNSYIANFTPPVVSADSTGLVTIAAHDRVYGNGTTVAVLGGTVATALANPAVARIYYDDPTRAGGAVTYQFTTDATVAVQTGDRHSVGAVQIPAAGSVDGGYVRPPGYVDYL
jgi:hypothetical protein